MENKNKMREWINKNDGKYFQVDNQEFNKYQAVGFILLILAFTIYLFHEKAGFEEIWLGWLLFFIGAISLIIGYAKRNQS